MSKLTVTTENDVLILEGLTRITHQEVQDMIRCIRAAQAETEGTSRLIDLSLVCEVELDYVQLDAMAELRKPDLPAGRAAFVYESPLVLGFIRMWQTLMSGEKVVIRSFRSRADAEKWLR